MRKLFISISFIISVCPAFSQISWNSPQEALNWLNSKIAGTKAGVMKYNQQINADFSISPECNLFVTIEQNGVVNSMANFIFYPEITNTSQLVPEVKGMFIYLNISTENNLKLIRETVQDIGQSFTNSFRLYFDDIQIARDAVEAIKYIKANLPNYNPYFNNKEDAYEWLGKNIGKANFGSVSVEQSFSFLADQNNKFILNTKEISSKGETKKDYEFYLADFKPEQIRVNASNSRINVTLTSTGEIKPVKYFLNGVQQNYTNKIEIFTDDAKKAFQIRAAFIYLITGNQDTPSQEANKTLDQKIVGLFKKEGNESSANTANNIDYTWIGIDFSKTKCIGEFSQGFGVAPASAEDIKINYFPSWNMLVVSEPDKYDVKKMIGNPNTKIDIEAMQKHNSNTSTDKIMGYSNPNYSAVDIQNFVQEYTVNGTGYGICFIVESLNKPENKAIIDFVVFDLATKKVLAIEKVEGKPGGMGIRNYWAGAIADVINTCQKNWVKAWKAKYGL